jgi:histone deacetylase complex regulatory component SIN3
VGALLDQGQGLEHRVVQVRGHVGPLLGPDPLLALGAEVGGQPEHPRADDQGQTGHPEQAGDQRHPSLAERAAVDTDHHQRHDHEHDARADPGVRRSIPARMDRHGGPAEVRSAPGEGTEVRVRLSRSQSAENP